MTFDGIGVRQYERLGIRVAERNDMPALTVVGQKGGSGRSTLDGFKGTIICRFEDTER